MKKKLLITFILFLQSIFTIITTAQAQQRDSVYIGNMVVKKNALPKIIAACWGVLPSTVKNINAVNMQEAIEALDKLDEKKFYQLTRQAFIDIEKEYGELAWEKHTVNNSPIEITSLYTTNIQFKTEEVPLKVESDEEKRLYQDENFKKILNNYVDCRDGTPDIREALRKIGGDDLLIAYDDPQPQKTKWVDWSDLTTKHKDTYDAFIVYRGGPLSWPGPLYAILLDFVKNNPSWEEAAGKRQAELRNFAFFLEDWYNHRYGNLIEQIELMRHRLALILNQKAVDTQYQAWLKIQEIGARFAKRRGISIVSDPTDFKKDTSWKGWECLNTKERPKAGAQERVTVANMLFPAIWEGNNNLVGDIVVYAERLLADAVEIEESGKIALKISEGTLDELKGLLASTTATDFKYDRPPAKDEYGGDFNNPENLYSAQRRIEELISGATPIQVFLCSYEDMNGGKITDLYTKGKFLKIYNTDFLTNNPTLNGAKKFFKDASSFQKNTERFVEVYKNAPIATINGEMTPWECFYKTKCYKISGECPILESIGPSSKNDSWKTQGMVDGSLVATDGSGSGAGSVIGSTGSIEAVGWWCEDNPNLPRGPKRDENYRNLLYHGLEGKAVDFVHAQGKPMGESYPKHDAAGNYLRQELKIRYIRKGDIKLAEGEPRNETHLYAPDKRKKRAPITFKSNNPLDPRSASSQKDLNERVNGFKNTLFSAFLDYVTSAIKENVSAPLCDELLKAVEKWKKNPRGKIPPILNSYFDASFHFNFITEGISESNKLVADKVYEGIMRYVNSKRNEALGILEKKKERVEKLAQEATEKTTALEEASKKLSTQGNLALEKPKIDSLTDFNAIFASSMQPDATEYAKQLFDYAEKLEEKTAGISNSLAVILDKKVECLIAIDNLKNALEDLFGVEIKKGTKVSTKQKDNQNVYTSFIKFFIPNAYAASGDTASQEEDPLQKKLNDLEGKAESIKAKYEQELQPKVNALSQELAVLEEQKQQYLNSSQQAKEEANNILRGGGNYGLWSLKPYWQWLKNQYPRLLKINADLETLLLQYNSANVKFFAKLKELGAIEQNISALPYEALLDKTKTKLKTVPIKNKSLLDQAYEEFKRNTNEVEIIFLLRLTERGHIKSFFDQLTSAQPQPLPGDLGNLIKYLKLKGFSLTPDYSVDYFKHDMQEHFTQIDFNDNDAKILTTVYKRAVFLYRTFKDTKQNYAPGEYETKIFCYDGDLLVIRYTLDPSGNIIIVEETLLTTGQQVTQKAKIEASPAAVVAPAEEVPLTEQAKAVLEDLLRKYMDKDRSLVKYISDEFSATLDSPTGSVYLTSSILTNIIDDDFLNLVEIRFPDLQIISPVQTSLSEVQVTVKWTREVTDRSGGKWRVPAPSYGATATPQDSYKMTTFIFRLLPDGSIKLFKITGDQIFGLSGRNTGDIIASEGSYTTLQGQTSYLSTDSQRTLSPTGSTTMLVTGTATLIANSGVGFRFITQNTAGTPTADIYYNTVAGISWWLANWGLGATAGMQSIADYNTKTLPTTGYLPSWNINNGDALAILTNEGKYAKIRINNRTDGQVAFEYTYQPNGTPNF